MAKETGFTSIAEALAAAQRAPRKPASAMPTPSRRPSRVPMTAVAAPAGGNDLRDEFDHALEAVETARRTIPRDAAAAMKMAANIVMAKCRVRQSEAADLVQRACRYLDK